MCRSYETCRGSHPGAFFEGQLHHVGPHYDLAVDGIPLRVVVVGQEYGKGPARVSVVTRTDMIVHSAKERRFRAEHGRAGRKPHLRATTSLLRALFGRAPGADYEGEWLQLATGKVHVFEAFALANFLLCSAVDADFGTDVDGAFFTNQKRAGQRGRATRVMKKNCATHFRRAIEILDPTVIIAQGMAVRRWIAQVFDSAESIHESLPVERVRLGSSQVVLATFVHPSAPTASNWGMNEGQPYLLDTVVPTATVIRQYLGVAG